MGVMKKILIAGLSLAGLTGLAGTSAHAQAAGYELDTVSATQFIAGTDGEIHGNGVCGDVKVSLVSADGTSVDLVTITADEAGVFDGKFTIPAATAVGDYTVVAAGTNCSGGAKSLRYAIKVVTEIVGDNGPSLALAGSESSRLLALASGLVVVGGAALGGVQLRRRRQTLTLA